eukprot:Phypoly_transcript_08489.p1 GENE.Phypoly_transcript_08489~~Phypoly_transcript_08489.p1  ORF type:complete len:491 (+),score=53.96 Phypoly_transcript_08489:49-1473(+)
MAYGVELQEKGDTREVREEDTWNFRILFVSIFSAIGGFLFGYDTGVISGVKAFDSYKEYFHHPSDVMNSVVVSAVLVGAMFGAYAAAPVSEAKGRRITILVGGVVFVLGAAIMWGAVHIGMLIAGRFVAGIGVGFASQGVPLYISEISPPSFRGALVSMNQLSITIGILVSYGINVGFENMDRGWSYPLGISAGPALLLTFGMIFLPETPYWLVMKGKEERAATVLRQLRKRQNVSHELEQMKSSNASKGNQAKEQGNWGEILTKSMLKLQMIGLGLTVFQQVVGINAINIYAPEIFTDVGFATNASLLATVIVGVVKVISTVIALYLVDRMGRRFLLLVGSTIMCVSMLIVGILSSQKLYDTHPTIGYVAIVFICTYCFGYAISWGPIAWVIPSEIFPLKLRGKMMTVATVGNWAANLLVSLTFLEVFAKIDWGVFILFGCVCAIAFILVFLFVPETKDKSLDELEKEFTPVH